MKEVSIRAVPDDEVVEIVHDLPGYAFRSSPPLQDKEIWERLLEQRIGKLYYALYEDNLPVACVARVPMTQQVRGKVFLMGGVYDVVTHPAVRRKGYASRLMTTIFEVMRSEGRPLTALYPFRESFYERQGYTAFPQVRWARMVPGNLGAILKKKLDGDIKLMVAGEGYYTYRAFLKKIQERTHGMGLFQHDALNQPEIRNYWLAFAEVKGEIAGVMMYNLRGERELEFDMRVSRFYTLNSPGRALLLDWIARHVDQARSVEILLPPNEMPEIWLPDLQVKTTSEVFAGMGRVLDITGIDGMQVGEGAFCALVIDPMCPWNEGIWRFESSAGKLQVSQGHSPDCTLNIQGISALVYGPHHPADFTLRGWGDPSPALQEVMRCMFPLQLPYLHEFF